MRVTMLEDTTVTVDGVKTIEAEAGESYEMGEGVATSLIAQGVAESAEPFFSEEAVPHLQLVDDTKTLPADPADDATLTSPAAALEHLNTLEQIDEASAYVEAALGKFPDDDELLAVKGRIDELVAQRAAPAAKLENKDAGAASKPRSRKKKA